MISFGAKYWFILLVSIFIASIGIVMLLYFSNKENRELSRKQILTLAALRFFSFFAIALLLLSPIIKNLKKISRKPILITAWDNSGSVIALKDSLQYLDEIQHFRNVLTEELKSDYDLIEYSFDEDAGKFENFQFNGKKSNYSNLISSVENNHFNENIGALIIAGDGIYNEGRNPVNMTDEISFPVFTIGLGDTTKVLDAVIKDIRTNRNSFSGNRFPVEIDVQFHELKGIPLQLSVLQDNKELSKVVVTPPNSNYFYSTSFTLEAGSPGLKHYTVQIETTDNERNIKNNSSEFVINVLENKQKILILSDGPHPDAGAIKNTLDLKKSYDVSVFTEEPYPSDLSSFNLIVLNQLPTPGKSAAEILTLAEKNRIPVLFIVGNKTFLPQLNTLNTGTTITPLAGSGELAQASLNTTYAVFNLSNDLKEMIPKYPPLDVHFAEYELESEFTPLFYQKLLNIETTKPLIATGVFNGRKTGFIFGEGIWKWRLYNYYLNQSHKQFDELISSLVQYLALRENEDNFIVEYQPVYNETEDVILKAEVYNDAFERISSQEVTIEIKNTNGEELNYTFDADGADYFLNAGNLATGDYTFESTVVIGDKTFYENGSFTVVPIGLEDIVTRANHNMLFQLAENSNGKFYTPDKTEQIISDLKNSNQLKTAIYFQELVHELLNLHWLFFVFLILLSVEWFLRKYWGIY